MTPPGGQSGPFSNLDYSQKGYSKIKRTDLGPMSAVSATLRRSEGGLHQGTAPQDPPGDPQNDPFWTPFLRVPRAYDLEPTI